MTTHSPEIAAAFAVLWLFNLGLTLIAVVALIYAWVTDRRWRQRLGALVLAVTLAGPFVATLHADEDELVIATRCSKLTVWDLEYWLLGCEFLP